MTFFPDSKTFLQIGSLSIAWYAILIITGAFIAYKIGQHNFKRIGYNKDILSDYFFGLLIIGIIGARIWYVIFMWDELYASNPIEIIMFRHGGLAIQGGIITGLIFSWWYFKKHNIDFLVAGDAIMPGVLIAQALGRWGNFFNQEAYGGVVSLDFLQSLHLPQFIIDGMYINGTYYHPTFLYESFWNLCLFILLMLYFKHRKFDGEVFLLYLLGYGIGRFWIESLRTDQLLIPHINYPVSMALAATLVAVSAIWIGIVRYKQMKMGKMVDTPPQSSTKE